MIVVIIGSGTHSSPMPSNESESSSAPSSSCLASASALVGVSVARGFEGCGQLSTRSVGVSEGLEPDQRVVLTSGCRTCVYQVHPFEICRGRSFMHACKSLAQVISIRMTMTHCSPDHLGLLPHKPFHVSSANGHQLAPTRVVRVDWVRVCAFAGVDVFFGSGSRCGLLVLEGDGEGKTGSFDN